MHPLVDKDSASTSMPAMVNLHPLSFYVFESVYLILVVNWKGNKVTNQLCDWCKMA